MSAPATLPDGAELRYFCGHDRRYSIWLYSARGAPLWASSRGAVSSIRPALARMRGILAGVDLDRDEAAIVADPKAQAAYVVLCREFGQSDKPVGQ